MMKSRLTAAIVIGLVVMQLVTIGVVVTIMSLTADDRLTEHVAGVAGAAATATSGYVDGYLTDAGQSLEATAGLAGQGLIDLSEPSAGEAYLLEQVAADERIDGMYWAGQSGEFVYVARSDEKSRDGFRTKVITIEANGPATTLLWRDTDFGLVEQLTDQTDTYDPTVRPWYMLATDQAGVVWTDPYIFYAARTPGITAALQIPDGATPGVIGTDIRLASLSHYLADEPVSDGSTAFVVTPAGQIVAHPDSAALIATDPANGALGVATIAAYGDPVVTAATGIALDGAVGEFTQDGTRYVVARDRLLNDWEVVVTAPESDFLGDLRATQRTGVYLVAAVALLALLVTVPLVIWMLRPPEPPEPVKGIDKLTTLPDRQAFHEKAAPAFAAARAGHKPVSVVMVDLDHFTQVNETYGHLTADEIVGAVGGRMRGALSDDDLIARFGGDEFAVLLPEVDVVTARTIAGRLRKAVTNAPIKTSHGPVYTTVSVGVAVATEPEATLEGLIHDADGALFQAKRGGRDRIEVANNKIVPVRRTTNN